MPSGNHRQGPGPVMIGTIPPGPPSDLKIEQFVGTVVALCPCKSRHPIVIPVVPGADGAYQCAECQVVWRVERVLYERPKPSEENPNPPDTMKVLLHGSIPNIVGARIQG